MYDYIRPAKVLAALEWLKENNPLYREVTINIDWEQAAAQDDTELWEALSSQHCYLPTEEIAAISTTEVAAPSTTEVTATGEAEKSK